MLSPGVSLFNNFFFLFFFFCKLTTYFQESTLMHLICYLWRRHSTNYKHFYIAHCLNQICYPSFYFMTQGKVCMCTSMPQSSSDASCRKPTEKLEIQRFIFSRILYFYLLCMCSASFHGFSLCHFICVSIFFSSVSLPPLYWLFQLYLTKIRFGIIFLSKQYSRLSTLSLMTCFIILLAIFYYTSAILLMSIRKIITFLCLCSKLA